MAQSPITNMPTYRNLPYIGETDSAGTNVIPALQYIKTDAGLFVPVSSANPAPVTQTGATPAGANKIGSVDVATMPAVAQGTPAADASPWPVKVTGSSLTLPAQIRGGLPEKSSVQVTHVATTVESYNATAGATQIEVYVESGSVRVRTDGQPATATTGEPLGEGFAGAWTTGSVSVYYVSDATITVVSR